MQYYSLVQVRQRVTYTSLLASLFSHSCCSLRSIREQMRSRCLYHTDLWPCPYFPTYKNLYWWLSYISSASNSFADGVVIILQIKFNKAYTLFWQIWWTDLVWASGITAVLQPALRSKTSSARLLPAVSTISVQFSVLKLNQFKGTKAYRQTKRWTNRYQDCCI